MYNKLLLFSISAILLLSSCSRPIAKFALENEHELKALEDISFINNSKNSESYKWNFGDGETSEQQNPNHIFYSSGHHIVELEVTKGNRKDVVKKDIFIAAPDKCTVVIETPFGNMVAELYDETPKHADNFVKLIEKGFYDNLLFHRVIDGFMIQGGDPNSKNAKKNARLGTGGPGYQVDAEFNHDLIHLKGALAAARTGGPSNPEKKSSGSQFYIVQGTKLSEAQLNQIESRGRFKYTDEQRKEYLEVGGTPFLDREYTVFGRVIKGLEVIDKIAAVKTNGADRPLEDVWMKMKVIK